MDYQIPSINGNNSPVIKFLNGISYKALFSNNRIYLKFYPAKRQHYNFYYFLYKIKIFFIKRRKQFFKLLQLLTAY